MAGGGITQRQSRLLGRAIMGLAVVQLVLFIAGAVRRSYLAVAIPVGVGVGVASGLAFWVGYTMATADWDDPADYVPDGDTPAAEPALTGLVRAISNDRSGPGAR